MWFPFSPLCFPYQGKKERQENPKNSLLHITPSKRKWTKRMNMQFQTARGNILKSRSPLLPPAAAPGDEDKFYVQQFLGVHAANIKIQSTSIGPGEYGTPHLGQETADAESVWTFTNSGKKLSNRDWSVYQKQVIP